jgi:hypothetical protein
MTVFLPMRTPLSGITVIFDVEMRRASAVRSVMNPG